MIAIVDYGMGNLRSVEESFLKVGVDARIVTDAASIDNADGVVLPGVGAFMDCIKNLTDMKLTEAIIKSIQKGKPYLGICLGLQVLFTESEEFGVCKGLNIFKGKVVRFPKSDLKVPHMGWNTICPVKDNPLLQGFDEDSRFYFLHSYYFHCDKASDSIATSEYGFTYASAVNKDNIYGIQFHPEKSHANGIQLLHNFAKL